MCVCVCVAFVLDKLQAVLSYPVGEEELKAAGSDAQRCEQPHGRQIRQENWKRGGQSKEEGGQSCQHRDSVISGLIEA